MTRFWNRYAHRNNTFRLWLSLILSTNLNMSWILVFCTKWRFKKVFCNPISLNWYTDMKYWVKERTTGIIPFGITASLDPSTIIAGLPKYGSIINILHRTTERKFNKVGKFLERYSKTYEAFKGFIQKLCPPNSTFHMKLSLCNYIAHELEFLVKDFVFQSQI